MYAWVSCRYYLAIYLGSDELQFRIHFYDYAHDSFGLLAFMYYCTLYLHEYVYIFTRKRIYTYEEEEGGQLELEKLSPFFGVWLD